LIPIEPSTEVRTIMNTNTVIGTIIAM